MYADVICDDNVKEEGQSTVFSIETKLILFK